MVPKVFLLILLSEESKFFPDLKIPTVVNVRLSELLLSKGEGSKVEICCEQLPVVRSYLLISKASQ